MVSDPRELQAGDIVEVHTEALSDALWRVSDTQVEDIGITETFAVTLVSDCEGDDRAYAAVGTTADSQFTLEAVDGDDEHRLFWKQVELA